jgi:hypothetical protein
MEHPAIKHLKLPPDVLSNIVGFLRQTHPTARVMKDLWDNDGWVWKALPKEHGEETGLAAWPSLVAKTPLKPPKQLFKCLAKNIPFQCESMDMSKELRITNTSGQRWTDSYVCREHEMCNKWRASRLREWCLHDLTSALEFTRSLRVAKIEIQRLEFKYV